MYSGVGRVSPATERKLLWNLRRVSNMRHLFLCAAAGLLLAPSWVPAGEPVRAKAVPPVPAKAEKDGETCGHGTPIDFLDTPKDAAEKAKKDEKLVFVLHVSGNFEDPRFT